MEHLFHLYGMVLNSFSWIFFKMSFLLSQCITSWLWPFISQICLLFLVEEIAFCFSHCSVLYFCQFFFFFFFYNGRDDYIHYACELVHVQHCCGLSELTAGCCFLSLLKLLFWGGGGDGEVFLFLNYSSRNKYMYLIAKVISFSISFHIYIIY